VISALDAHGRALYLLVRVKTVNTSETCSVRALLDSRATGSFVDQDFIQTHQISTRKLSRPVPVFNVDGTPNEAREISEVADVVLQYNTHSGQMFLTVSSLHKQDLILGFP